MPGVPVELLPDDELVFQTGGPGGELADSDLPLASALLSKAAPPCFISFLNLERLFWNQILTCSPPPHRPPQERKRSKHTAE